MTPDELAAITGTWDYTTLPSTVRLGAGVWLERKESFARFRSTRDHGLVLGDRVRVFTWTTFNIEPTGTLIVGEDSTLVGATFMCAERIEIGRRVLISYHVTIADSDFHPLDPGARKRDAIANAPFGDKSARPTYTSRPVHIEDDVSIGIGAIILKGVRIGAGAQIGPGAIVIRDVPPGTSVAGNPAREVARRDSAG